MTEELRWLVSAGIAIFVVGVFYLFWNLFALPSKMEKEASRIATEKQNEIQKQADKCEAELTNVKDARPHIVPRGVRNIVTPIYDYSTVVINGHPGILGEPCFTQVLFANDPQNPLQAVDAINVAGHIDMWDQNKRRVFYMIGRWSGTREEISGALPSEMEQVTIHPNGREEPLDIALKYESDEDGFGHNNESRRKATRDWRDASVVSPLLLYNERPFQQYLPPAWSRQRV